MGPILAANRHNRRPALPSTTDTNTNKCARASPDGLAQRPGRRVMKQGLELTASSGSMAPTSTSAPKSLRKRGSKTDTRAYAEQLKLWSPWAAFGSVFALGVQVHIFVHNRCESAILIIRNMRHLQRELMVQVAGSSFPSRAQLRTSLSWLLPQASSSSPPPGNRLPRPTQVPFASMQQGAHSVLGR
jgi:hypothetical protein